MLQVLIIQKAVWPLILVLLTISLGLFVHIPPRRYIYGIFLDTVMLFINNGFYACKGMHSDAFLCYVSVLLGSRDS